MLLRLAMIFALCDLRTQIDVQHIQAAMGWIRLGVESAKFVFVKSTDAADSVRTSAAVKNIIDFRKRSTNPRLTNHCQLRQACAISTQMEKRTCKHDQPHLRNTVQRPGAKESPWPHMPKRMASQLQPCTAGNKSCARPKPLQLTQLP